MYYWMDKDMGEKSASHHGNNQSCTWTKRNTLADRWGRQHGRLGTCTQTSM
uniref:Uncharacterized protein n=1 Tax=Arundo donax TaxID=35708 RepID=A0A0A9C9L5_ARUDO